MSCTLYHNFAAPLSQKIALSCCRWVTNGTSVRASVGSVSHWRQLCNCSCTSAWRFGANEVMHNWYLLLYKLHLPFVSLGFASINKLCFAQGLFERWAFWTILNLLTNYKIYSSRSALLYFYSGIGPVWIEQWRFGSNKVHRTESYWFFCMYVSFCYPFSNKRAHTYFLIVCKYVSSTLLTHVCG